jgi:transcriptional regulator with XRE-family HTH domain
MITANRPVGDLLRTWRQQRRLSQLELALDADVSTRHISFLENGRAQPSREMLLHLAERLDIPLRERNSLLVAAGFAPAYRSTPLDDPSLKAAREAIERVLVGHEPYPALAIDRHWSLVMANSAVGLLLSNVDPKLLTPPVNVLRVSLHPEGLAPQIVNLDQWRGHVLDRLQHQIDATADGELVALRDELVGYVAQDAAVNRTRTEPDRSVELVIPLRLRTEQGTLSFFGTTMLFGMVNDITLAEIAIESFFPADATTAEAMRRAANSPT